MEWSGCVLRLVLVRSLKLSTHYSVPRNWMGDCSVNGSKYIRPKLPPEEDLQIYKWSLVKFHSINASSSRINCAQIATPNPKTSD